MQKSVLTTIGMLAAAAGTLGAATTNRVQAPVFGYAALGSGDVQPIYGIRGALLRGPALSLAGGSRAFMAPTQSYALVSTAGVDDLQLLPLTPDSSGTLQSITGAWADAGQVIFNPGGSAALLYSQSRHAVQIVTGLPANPQAGPALNVTVAEGDSPRFALSDDGTLLALASGGALQLLGAQGGVIAQAAIGQSAVLSFVSQSGDLLSADPQTSSLSRWRVQDNQLQPEALLSGDPALTAPTAIAVSADASRLWIANGDGQVLEYRLATQTRSAFDCGCHPAALSAMTQSSTALLNAGDGSGVWLLDSTGDTPLLTYVPANQGGQQ